MFIGRTDVKAETPVLWPPHAKSWLIGKDSDAARDWGQEEKGMTQDQMAGWHHGLDGRESEWTPGDGDGQGGLACCDSWSRKESDTTDWLNWTELIVRKDWYSILQLIGCVNFDKTGVFCNLKRKNNAYKHLFYINLAWKRHYQIYSIIVTFEEGWLLSIRPER